MRKNVLLFSGIALLAYIFLMGCGSSDPVDIPDDSGLSSEALEGKKLVEERCTVCHNLDRIYSEKRGKSKWEEIVEDMVKRGAKANSEERVKIIDYLTGLE